MRRATPFLLSLLSLPALLSGAGTGVDAAPAPSPTPEFIRGITITCPGAGEIWGSPAMRQALAEVRDLGAGWVSVHPYSWLRKSGELRFRPAEDEAYLARAAAMTRDEGLELFWKPHVGYWGHFKWRGDIAFGDDQAAWGRFFKGYGAWIVDQARFAQRHGIPLFAVGVELEGTTSAPAHEAQWRRIIAEVRKVYRGRITYSANWDRLHHVPFWDALDLISVQAYFPLSEAADPSVAEIRSGWDSRLEELRELSRRHGGKRILFAELGYNPSPRAAREPWAYEVERSPAALSLRRRLMEVALERLELEPAVAGIVWWKWMPGSLSRRHNFSLREPEVQEMLRRAWAPQG